MARTGQVSPHDVSAQSSAPLGDMELHGRGKHKRPPARTKEIQGTDFTGTTQSQRLPQCQTGSRGSPTNVQLGVLIVRVYRKCRCG